jgi:xanthine dehydrogenase YagS FAD-binding subunit
LILAHIQNGQATRSVPINEFYVLPGDAPQRETVLEPGDLITHVTLPAPVANSKSLYLKLRDRASYEFALASVAVIVKIENNQLSYARVALGGVGTKPWRSKEAEQALAGATLSESSFRNAAEAVLHGARPQSQNGFKIELAKRCLTHALKLATQTA